jgi:hypothetical protein
MILGLGLMTLSQAQAGIPYSFPVHKDVSLNNYNDTGFAKGQLPHRFESKSELKVGQEVMVNDRYQSLYRQADRGTYYSSLARLDRIKILDLNGDDSNKFLKVEVLSSSDRRLVGKEFYTRIVGLSEYEDFKNFDSDVYMVQNIATEKLRVYQRVCKDNSCPPKMIFETEFVAGEKKGDKRNKYNTHVGNYRIYEWVKFYQDKGSGGHYPSWYDPDFPEQPGPEESWSKWFKDDIMPWEYCETDSDGDQKCSYSGMMRGAFGWYTALMEPHYGSGQWTHGTIGWSESSQEMIRRAKGEDFFGSIANIFTSLRSSGCSRVSNPSVAFLKHILPVGTPLFKVYALEAYQDQESMERNYRVGEKSTWDFMLTKDGVRESNDEATSAHRNYVEMRTDINSPDNIIEEGTYEFNVFPSIVQYQYKPKNSGGYRRSKGCVEDAVDNYNFEGESSEDRYYIGVSEIDKINKKECNVYKIPAETFQGKFYVDTGLIEGYKHPVYKNNDDYDVIIRGGFRSQFFPDYFQAASYK